LDSAAVGELSAAHGIVLHELSLQKASLEDAFIDLTDTAVDYRSTASEPVPAAGAGRPT
jgi:ABC-2 type transport system ATP-binding protein